MKASLTKRSKTSKKRICHSPTPICFIKTVKEAPAICRSFLDGVVIFRVNVNWKKCKFGKMQIEKKANLEKWKFGTREIGKSWKNQNQNQKFG